MPPRWTRCVDPTQSTYEIVWKGADNIEGGRAWIRFHPCGVESPHPDDIRNHYCAHCHEWIAHPARATKDG